MQKKHITILGGSGFVGSSLATYLANHNYPVKILTRSKNLCRRLNVLPQVQICEGNVHSSAFLARELLGADCVINLVGILNESGNDGAGFKRAHFELTNSVLAACEQSGVNKIIYMSSLKADAEQAPSHYLKSKGDAENAIRRNNNAKLKWSILQPSLIFGEHDSFVNRFARLLRMPLPFFPQPRANARVAPVYVEDVVLAIVACIENRETNSTTFQLCGPHVYSLREIMQIIADVQQIKKTIIGLPDGLSRIIAALSEFIPGKPFSKDNYKSLTVHSICDIDGFGRLGIKPHSLKSIIRTYLGPHVKMRRFGLMRSKAGR